MIKRYKNYKISVHIPLYVDPKKKNFNCYKDCTIFKPNLTEIKEGMNIEFNADKIEKIEKASAELRELLNAKGVLLTLSAKGICINTKNNFTHTPAFKRNIIDVSGAGDTFLAGLVCEYLRSQSLDKAIQFANRCARVVVQKPNVAFVTAEELDGYNME